MEAFFTQTISQAIEGKSVFTILIVFGSGLITSISPCILSMLPVMVAYIGGYDNQITKNRGFALSAAFVFGMATTFAVLGLIAASIGLIFGQIGSIWYYILSAAAIMMGLNLLGVVRFNMPGLKRMPFKLTGCFGTYIMGLFFGIAASPCATPVLAVIMTYVALQKELIYGGFLLFVYGVGHGLPLILAGTFTVLLKKLPGVQHYTKYVNYFSGGILILFGLYLLSRGSR